MLPRSAEIVVCGAGIAGIAAAYHLAVRRGLTDVVIVDERPPLSLTSDKSAECYRNWWPGPGDDMVALMNRSIDLLEELARESGNVFRMNRRGYLFATADPALVPRFIERAREGAALGSGPMRLHDHAGSDYRPPAPDGFEDESRGSDVVTDRALIRRHYGWLAEDTVALLHARRCGWFSGQQLGMYMLERARDKGVRLLEGRVAGVEMAGGRVTGVRVDGAGGTRTISTPRFVAAAGPLMKEAGRLVGVELPLFCERHAKVTFSDTLGVIPRSAPLTLWTDAVRLPWSDDERAELAESEHRHLLDEFPAGVHGRPEGGGDSPVVVLIWTYDVAPTEPRFPPAFDPYYAEITLRGMSRMVPGLAAYLQRLPRAFVDGGYYTRTRENRLLAGPLPVEGAFILGGLSGYGLMSSNGAADLLADHITGRTPPRYAPAFRLERYDDAAYVESLESWGDDGQL